MFKSWVLLHAAFILTPSSASDVVIATHENYSKIINSKHVVLLKYYAPVDILLYELIICFILEHNIYGLANT